MSTVCLFASKPSSINCVPAMLTWFHLAPPMSRGWHDADGDDDDADNDDDDESFVVVYAIAVLIAVAVAVVVVATEYDDENHARLPTLMGYMLACPPASAPSVVSLALYIYIYIYIYVDCS